MNTKVSDYEILPKNTYNIDEKGFMLGALLKIRRIFTRAEFERGSLLSAGQDGSRQWITLVAAICQDCTYLPLLLIYTGALGNV